MRFFTANPDTQLTTWGSEPGTNAPHYGSVYLFMAYFLEQFGEEMTRLLVASGLNGIAGFDDVLTANNTGANFDAIFADWIVANLLDDPSVHNGRFGYQSADPVRRALRPTSGATRPSKMAVRFLSMPPTTLR